MENTAGYQQDASGEWWYYLSPKRRTRAAESSCEVCGSLFPAYRPQRYCSKQCAGVARRIGPESRDEEIEQRYRAGATGNEIAEAVGVSSALVYQVLRKRGVEARPAEWAPSSVPDVPGQAPFRRAPRRVWTPRVFTDDERAMVRDAYYNWEEMNAIAKRLQVRVNAVSTLMREMDLPPRVARKRQRHVTRYQRPDGYVFLWRDERWIQEHRVVMAEKLGRPLASHEVVHHINAVRNDNRPENLELWQTAQPRGRRAVDPHCETCTCFEDVDDE